MAQSEIPHLASPMSFSAKGVAATVEQDEQADLDARVFNVLVCEENFRQDLPEYGAPSLLFQIVPLDLGPFQAAIERWTGVDVTVEELEEYIPPNRKVLVGVP